MSDNVIDFNKSKQKLINKKYPNVSPILPSKNEVNFVNTSKAFQQFQSIFYEYQENILNKDDDKRVTLEEVLVYFNRYFDEAYKETINYDLTKIPKFKEALDYAMLSQGKRLRPFLIFIAYNFCGGDNHIILTPLMVAIELIHTFSLVHDDLPCMDNDELRRGKPTVWKKYGEDIAVLVGDALLMEANTLLTETVLEFAYTDIGAYVTTSALLLLKLAGLDGMIAGQVYDVMNTQNKKLNLKDITYMYNKKTTALLTASLVIGFNMSAKYKKNVELIETLSSYIGESYQIKDDLLEVESTTEVIGKSVDSDKKNGKVTFVTLVGVEEAKKRLQMLYDAAMQTIDIMAEDVSRKETKVFKDVVRYILNREK